MSLFLARTSCCTTANTSGVPGPFGEGCLKPVSFVNSELYLAVEKGMHSGTVRSLLSQRDSASVLTAQGEQ